MPITVPARHNEKLAHIMETINTDRELHQLWKCANVNAMDRSGITDHGEVHIRIVANIALRIVRLLDAAGVPLSIVQNYDLTVKEAEIVVVLAACYHDLGISIHRHRHEEYSLFLAERKALEVLTPQFDVEERTILTSEILHAVAAHRADETCLTIEAGVLKVADALDMTEGRSRIPFEAGALNIHSVSAAAIDKVTLTSGREKPVHIEILMNNSAGIFQVDELLKRKVNTSTIAPYVELVARVTGEGEKSLVEIYSLPEA